MCGSVGRDAGEYGCRLSNKLGLTEVVARVTVGVRPQLVGRPNELDVTVGDEATFECSYRAFPSPDVYWCHNRQPLTVSRLPSRSSCRRFTCNYCMQFLLKLLHGYFSRGFARNRCMQFSRATR